jgi:hypothetical protein
MGWSFGGLRPGKQRRCQQHDKRRADENNFHWNIIQSPGINSASAAHNLASFGI